MIRRQIAWHLSVTGSFVLLVPSILFILLCLKGLPDFAKSHLGQVVIWAYGVAWVPALLAGLLLSLILWAVVRKTRYFHDPYDFGRSFSLGAVLGALLEALTTGAYRAFSGRPYSDFWMAGAMIAGCLAGAAIVAMALWRVSWAHEN